MTAPLNKSLFTFLEELKKNNNREWFTVNKDRYEQQVANPLLDFIVNMAPELEKISPQYEAIPKKTGGSLFRIYRDVRFSKDKTPYKTHAACQFRHRLGKTMPEFYLHLDTQEILLGGGIWMPSPEVLFKIRDRIRQKPNEWKKIVEDKHIKKMFDGISHNSLTRPPKGFDKDLNFINDIKCKSFFALRREPVNFALQENFTQEVGKTFKNSTPLMQFLCKAIGIRF